MIDVATHLEYSGLWLQFWSMIHTAGVAKFVDQNRHSLSMASALLLSLVWYELSFLSNYPSTLTLYDAMTHARRDILLNVHLNGFLCMLCGCLCCRFGFYILMMQICFVVESVFIFLKVMDFDNELYHFFLKRWFTSVYIIPMFDSRSISSSIVNVVC